MVRRWLLMLLLLAAGGPAFAGVWTTLAESHGKPNPGALPALEQEFERLIAAHGFPTPRASGESDVQACWQLLAATRAPFRRAQLPRLQTLADAGLIDRPRFAQFVDDLLTDLNQPQRYGTALRNLGDTLLLLPLEDPQQVDERRRAMGLIPLAQYLDLMEKMHGRKISRVKVRP